MLNFQPLPHNFLPIAVWVYFKEFFYIPIYTKKKKKVLSLVLESTTNILYWFYLKNLQYIHDQPSIDRPTPFIFFFFCLILSLSPLYSYFTFFYTFSKSFPSLAVFVFYSVIFFIFFFLERDEEKNLLKMDAMSKI